MSEITPTLQNRNRWALFPWELGAQDLGAHSVDTIAPEAAAFDHEYPSNDSE